MCIRDRKNSGATDVQMVDESRSKYQPAPIDIVQRSRDLENSRTTNAQRRRQQVLDTA